MSVSSEYDISCLINEYESNGSYAAAARQLERLLARYEASTDENKMEWALSRLANVYRLGEHSAKAKEIESRLLARWLPRVETGGKAISENVGVIYHTWGDLERAESFYLRAIDSSRGDADDSSAVSSGLLANLAGLYREMHRYEESVDLGTESLRILEAGSEPDRIAIARQSRSLGRTFQEMGRMSEAQRCFAHAICLLEEAVNVNNSELAGALIDLAGLTYLQKDYSESMSLYEKAFGGLRATVGEYHPLTELALRGMAMSRKAQDRVEDAIVLFERLLPIQERVLGKTHPDTIATRGILST